MQASDPSGSQVKREIEIIRNTENEIPTLRELTFELITKYFEDYLLNPFSGVAFADNNSDFEINKSVRYSEDRVLQRSPIPFDRDWTFKLTSEFKKDIKHHNDKKFQGRVFEAITELSSNPTETQGDTIKRLSGEFAGKWRYRIGEYRLIYLPDLTSHTIVLLAIRPRGEAYD